MGKYQYIAKADTNSGTSPSNITFNNIPQTYTDLYLMGIMKTNSSSASTDATLYYNNSQTALYGPQLLYATSGSVGSSNVFGDTSYFTRINGSVVSNNYVHSNTQIFIPNYSRTDRHKSTLFVSSSNQVSTVGLAYTQFGVVTWQSNNAITRIDLTPSGWSWVQYCTWYLYGINSTP